MSKKRTSAESNNDEQTNEGSESLFQKEDNAKRARLDSLSDTTLQDLPIELLQCILVKAVAMEVKGLKLARSVWKEKADLVISRLTTVCSDWRSILTTNFFRNQHHRTLDDTAQQTIRLEILHQFPIQSHIYGMTTLNDEIFMLCRPRDHEYVINVCNRNNTEEVKDVIPLPGTFPQCMAACNVSNCVYVGLLNKNNLCRSVSRVTKDEEHKFNISPWISDHKEQCAPMCVSPNGSLIILSEHEGVDYKAMGLSIYDANGSLLREITLSPDIDDCIQYVEDVIAKSNGNLVLVSSDEETQRIKLMEIDASGNVVRKYLSSLNEWACVHFTGTYDRIMITKPDEGKIELLDSEFNLLDFALSQQDEDLFYNVAFMHCDSERNEVTCTSSYADNRQGVLTIFRFTEE